MTTINHGINSSLVYIFILKLFSFSNIVVLSILGTLGFILGIAPDIIGYIEKIVKKDKTVWNWYLECHSGRTNEVMKYTLVWGIHTYLDSL
jgi:hypothetical protein